MIRENETATHTDYAVTWTCREEERREREKKTKEEKKMKHK